MEGTHLSFQQLETGTPTGANVAELVFCAVLCNNSRGVSSPNDDHSAFTSRFEIGIEESPRSSGEGRELKYARRPGFHEWVGRQP